MERKKRRQIKNLNSNKIYINEKYLQIMFKKIKVHEELLLHSATRVPGGPILGPKDSTRTEATPCTSKPPKESGTEGNGRAGQETTDTTGEDADISSDQDSSYGGIKTKKCNIL